MIIITNVVIIINMIITNYQAVFNSGSPDDGLGDCNNVSWERQWEMQLLGGAKMAFIPYILIKYFLTL